MTAAERQRRHRARIRKLDLAVTLYDVLSTYAHVLKGRAQRLPRRRRRANPKRKATGGLCPNWGKVPLG
jgi:hypothetical protein